MLYIDNFAVLACDPSPSVSTLGCGAKLDTLKAKGIEATPEKFTKSLKELPHVGLTHPDTEPDIDYPIRCGMTSLRRRYEPYSAKGGAEGADQVREAGADQVREVPKAPTK